MGIFGRIGKALSGPSAKVIAIQNAEKMLSMLAGTITDGQKAALATVAKDLTRRFDYGIDVTSMPSNHPMFQDVMDARGDLLAAANLSTKERLSPAATQMFQNMALASLVFYHLIVMRGIAAEGGPDGQRANYIADTYTGFLNRIFPK